MNTHTPGPWMVQKPEDGLVSFNHHTLGERPTVEIWAAGEHGSRGFYHAIALVADNDTANARLIAAAPEMLHALKCILGDGVPADDPAHVDFNQAISLARAAVAKAEGR